MIPSGELTFLCLCYCWEHVRPQHLLLRPVATVASVVRPGALLSASAAFAKQVSVLDSVLDVFGGSATVNSFASPSVGSASEESSPFHSCHGGADSSESKRRKLDLLFAKVREGRRFQELNVHHRLVAREVSFARVTCSLSTEQNTSQRVYCHCRISIYRACFLSCWNRGL